ncbi:hypothetical protein BDZ88DRAFT_139536 [Geranomyces variabilis]|nr:hypothetical protein BDZ88DRAFT_139536 [Geranomyces variabilis]KAJ3143519.1 hypothetical protein HDU90_000281 [Geranomyces variabilis]
MSFMKWIGSKGAGGKGGSVNTDWALNGDDRYYGLENYGNTCYCNSVVQALYFCKPFRSCVEGHGYSRTLLPLTLPSEASIASPPLKTASSTLTTMHGYFGGDAARGGKDPKPVGGGEKESVLSKLDWKRKDSAVKAAAAATNNGGSAKPVLASALSGNTSNGAIPEMLELKASDSDTLLSSLHDLFVSITSQKKKTGTIGPRVFISTLKRENALFRSTMHQDAHEMLNYLLNAIAEILLRQTREEEEKLHYQLNGGLQIPNGANQPRAPSPLDAVGKANGYNIPRFLADPQRPAPPPRPSWVHELFEGLLTNETKCLTCETVTSRDETFLDLSVDVEPNCSLSYCLRNFSKSETLCQKNKFFCDNCRSLQEAEKRMIVRQAPNILAVHLKRFKYQEQVQRYIKLAYSVPFPLELRLSHFVDNADDPERLYGLFAVIVHIGTGPHHGHYVTLVKSNEQWLLFDDDEVSPVEESELHRYYGDDQSAGCGYIFFYKATSFQPPHSAGQYATGEDGAFSQTSIRTSQDPPPAVPQPQPQTHPAEGTSFTQATYQPPPQPLPKVDPIALTQHLNGAPANPFATPDSLSAASSVVIPPNLDSNTSNSVQQTHHPHTLLPSSAAITTPSAAAAAVPSALPPAPTHHPLEHRKSKKRLVPNGVGKRASLANVLHEAAARAAAAASGHHHHSHQNHQNSNHQLEKDRPNGAPAAEAPPPTSVPSALVDSSPPQPVPPGATTANGAGSAAAAEPEPDVVVGRGGSGEEEKKADGWGSWFGKGKKDREKKVKD